jgi:hypothetical protein
MRQQSSKTGNVSNNTKTDHRLKNYRIRVVNLYVYAKLFNIMQKQTNKQKKKSSPKFKIMLKFNARRHGVQVVRQHGQSFIGKHLHVHALGQSTINRREMHFVVFVIIILS